VVKIYYYIPKKAPKYFFMGTINDETKKMGMPNKPLILLFLRNLPYLPLAMVSDDL